MTDRSREDLEAQIERYQNLILEDPHNPEHHKELGNAFHRSGAFDLALEEYGTALHIDPSYFPAQYNMGNTYFAQERFHRAIIAWQKALILQPEMENAIYNIAYTYYQLAQKDGQTEEERRRYLYDAAVGFQNAINLVPDSKDSHLHLGLTWYDLDLYDKAVEEYEAVLRLDADDSDAFYNMGNAYYEKGFADPSYFEKAIECYQRAIQLNPRDNKSRNNIADCCLRLDRLPLAKKEIERVLEDEPGYLPARCTHGEILSREGSHEKAIAEFQRIIVMDPTENRILHKYASQKLIEEYNLLLSRDGESHRTRCALGKAYRDLGTAYGDRSFLTRARDELRKATAADPSNPRYHIELAECYLLLQNPDYALMEVEAALALDSSSIEAQCILGEIYTQTGDRELVQQTFAAIKKVCTQRNG